MGTDQYKIGISSINGHMGQILDEVLRTQEERENFIYSGGACRKDSKEKYVRNGHFVGGNLSFEELFGQSDCVIDFSHPDALRNNLDQSVNNSVALVIGTTGLSNDQEKMMANASKNIPVVYAANTSIGVTIMQDLVEKAAALLGDDYDLEIFEAHHNRKIDSPSGTALALGKSAAKGRNVDFEKVSMSNMGKRDMLRKKGDIGFSVLRGGDIVGEHSVGFYGQYDRFEIKHAASSSKLFADGALKAALWLKDRDAGLYTMRDVLGLS